MCPYFCTLSVGGQWNETFLNCQNHKRRVKLGGGEREGEGERMWGIGRGVQDAAISLFNLLLLVVNFVEGLCYFCCFHPGLSYMWEFGQ